MIDVLREVDEVTSQTVDHPVRPYRDALIRIGIVSLFLVISGLKPAEPKPVFISAFYRAPLHQLYSQSISNP